MLASTQNLQQQHDTPLCTTQCWTILLAGRLMVAGATATTAAVACGAGMYTSPNEQPLSCIVTVMVERPGKAHGMFALTGLESAQRTCLLDIV